MDIIPPSPPPIRPIGGKKAKVRSSIFLHIAHWKFWGGWGGGRKAGTHSKNENVNFMVHHGEMRDSNNITEMWNVQYTSMYQFPALYLHLPKNHWYGCAMRILFLRRPNIKSNQTDQINIFIFPFIVLQAITTVLLLTPSKQNLLIGYRYYNRRRRVLR